MPEATPPPHTHITAQQAYDKFIKDHPKASEHPAVLAMMKAFFQLLYHGHIQ